MNTMEAYLKAKAARAAGASVKVFDWDKAARMIVQHRPDSAGAGLSGDWEWTGGTIYSNGEPELEDNTYVYLASNHATPEIQIDGIKFACWVYREESDGWDVSTYWPESALNILRAGGLGVDP